MLVLHTETSAHGCEFWAAADDTSREPLGRAALVAALASVVWYPEEVEPAAENRARTSDRNLLMFLSDVRGRRFKTGIFLAEDTLRAAATFRAVCAETAAGRYAPTVERRGDHWLALWKPLEAHGDENETAFRNWCTDALARRAGRTVMEGGDAARRSDTVDEAWLAALRSDDPIIRWRNPEELADLARRAQLWIAPVAANAAAADLSFKLTPPKREDGQWRVTLGGDISRRAGLFALGRAAEVWGALRGMRGGALAISRHEAENFIRAGAPALAAAGFGVEIPNEMRGEHLNAEAELAPLNETAAPSPSAKNIGAKLKVRIDGKLVGADEIEFLLEQGSPFVFFRNRWIEIDRGMLKEALRIMRSAETRKLSAHEAIAFAAGVGRVGRLKIAQVKARGWLRGLLNELKGEKKFRLLEKPAGFRGELRDYQLRGYSWLAFLTKWGFGPCLADDMGLGKTVQTIAFVLHHLQAAKRPVLIVAPVSVATNWQREFAAFAPGLKIYLHQGAGRMSATALRCECLHYDVVITGYSLLVKDFRDLAAAGFSALVLDEAQTIKNPDAKVSRAARAMNAPVRIALTGTPVENSVDDLWALQEFLNPGLLGERGDFAEAFSRTIRQDVHSAAVKKLRRIVEPFMLRRLKTDPAIAKELGAKRERREYCPLTAPQRRAYEDALAAYRADAEAAGGGSAAYSRGRMLALLTELKLVCDGEGKIVRLVELLNRIFANGESCLVFTQYAKIGKLLRERLTEEFGREFPFLHGALTAAQRDAEIAAFNRAAEPAAFILSLKAGGFGLNLTRATHVIHFDRWWNPAVENQATDRAHRLGQTRTAIVHTFICAGTLEDRIDALLESKRLLAGEIVGAGESFLAGMNREAFEALVALDGAAGGRQ